MNNASNLINANPSRLDHFYKAYSQKVMPTSSKTSHNYISQFWSMKESDSKFPNSLLFSPKTKKISNNNKYWTNENKQRISKKRTTKKINQTSLVRNKDYIQIGDCSSEFLMTERKVNFLASPSNSGLKKKKQGLINSTKIIKLDGENESNSWFNLKEIENTFKNWKSILKETMKNYFVFLEFLNMLTKTKIKDSDQSSISGDASELIVKNQQLFYKELKNMKNLNMDIDGIQKQIEEFDKIIMNITEISEPKAARIQNEWNAETAKVPWLGINCQTSEENQSLKDKLELYHQKCVKLEFDLKREKEQRNIKYYRSDKKIAEIKKLTKTKDELLETWLKYEDLLKDLESKNRKVLSENIQLNDQIQILTSQCNSLKKNPPMDQSDYQNKIKDLENEINELRQLIDSFEATMKIGDKKEENKELLEKLSLMLLNKNIDHTFFSESQKEMIRTLFGDYATTTYK